MYKLLLTILGFFSIQLGAQAAELYCDMDNSDADISVGLIGQIESNTELYNVTFEYQADCDSGKTYRRNVLNAQKNYTPKNPNYFGYNRFTIGVRAGRGQIDRHHFILPKTLSGKFRGYYYEETVWGNIISATLDCTVN